VTWLTPMGFVQLLLRASSKDHLILSQGFRRLDSLSDSLVSGSDRLGRLGTQVTRNPGDNKVFARSSSTTCFYRILLLRIVFRLLRLIDTHSATRWLSLQVSAKIRPPCVPQSFGPAESTKGVRHSVPFLNRMLNRCSLAQASTAFASRACRSVGSMNVRPNIEASSERSGRNALAMYPIQPFTDR
jgi:hypothetical protein